MNFASFNVHKSPNVNLSRIIMTGVVCIPFYLVRSAHSKLYFRVEASFDLEMKTQSVCIYIVYRFRTCKKISRSRKVLTIILLSLSQSAFYCLSNFKGFSTHGRDSRRSVNILMALCFHVILLGQYRPVYIYRLFLFRALIMNWGEYAVYMVKPPKIGSVKDLFFS